MVNPTKQFFYDIRSGRDRQSAFDRFRRSTHRRQAAYSRFKKLERKGVVNRPVQGPKTESGEFYTGGSKRITETVDPLGGQFYTREAYQQRTGSQYQRMLGVYRGIDEGGTYLYKGFEVGGLQLKTLIRPSVEGSRSQFVGSLELGPYSTIKRTDKGFEIGTDVELKQYSDWQRASVGEKVGRSIWVGFTQWPRTIVETGFSPVTGQTFKSYGDELRSWESGTWDMARARDYGGIAREAALSPSMTYVVYPMAGSALVGAGIGGFKATSIGSKVLFNIGKRSITPGTLLEGGIVGYGTYETGKSFINDPIETAKGFAATLPTSLLGYRMGYNYGYGRVEQFSYLSKTYGYGTPAYKRASSILKVARRFQGVKLSRGRLDLMSDIVDMDSGTARAMELFMSKYKGKFTLGGSGSTRGQLGSGFRRGRDIDIFMKKEKLVSSAYGFIKKSGGDVSRFDIHGPEFYKPGRYHMFGFIEKRGVPLDVYSGGRYLGKVKSISPSEQLFRKAVAVSRLERQYRWGEYPGVYTPPNLRGFVKGPKDIADVVSISKGMISKTSKSWNPFTRMSSRSADLNLYSFFNPSESTFPMIRPFTANVTAGQFLIPTTTGVKPISDKTFNMFSYPTNRTVYPSNVSFPFNMGGYWQRPAAWIPPFSTPKFIFSDYEKKDYTKSINYPSSIIISGYKPSTGYTPPKPPPVYIPSYKPPDNYKPPSYIPPYKPPPGYTPPKPPPSFYPPYTPFKRDYPKTPRVPKVEDDYSKVLKKMFKNWDTGYRQRSWGGPRLSDLLKIKI